MKRRTYLATVASASAAGTAGCFWKDSGGSDPRLAAIIVSNYADRRQQLVVHVEADGQDALIDEIELAPGDNADPTASKLDCNWTTDSDEFTIELILLNEPHASRTVSVPGDRYRSYDVGDCVGLNFGIGSPGGGRISSSFHDCAEYVNSFELCSGVEGSS